MIREIKIVLKAESKDLNEVQHRLERIIEAALMAEEIEDATLSVEFDGEIER